MVSVSACHLPTDVEFWQHVAKKDASNLQCLASTTENNPYVSVQTIRKAGVFTKTSAFFL